MSWKRIVYFYKLSLYTEQIMQPLDGQTTVRRYYQNNDEIFNAFNQVYPARFSNNGTFRAIALEPGVNQVTFEVIDLVGQQLFARIGRINDNNTIQLRDTATLASNDINRGATQGIETYTYLLIDFSTSIISYVGTQGAPGINKLWALFENNIPDLHAEIIPIAENDVMEIIRHKRTIANVKFTVSLPSDQVLGMDGYGIDRRDFDAVRNLKHQTITIALQAEREQSLFENSNTAIDMVNGVLRKFNRDNIRDISVSAKDPDENIHSYGILEHEITRKVPLRRDDQTGGLNMFEVKDRLVEVYSQNRNNLVRNCR
jgi:hypothetical protein